MRIGPSLQLKSPGRGTPPLLASNLRPSLISKFTLAPAICSYLTIAFFTAFMSERRNTKTDIIIVRGDLRPIYMLCRGSSINLHKIIDMICQGISILRIICMLCLGLSMGFTNNHLYALLKIIYMLCKYYVYALPTIIYMLCRESSIALPRIMYMLCIRLSIWFAEGYQYALPTIIYILCLWSNCHSLALYQGTVK